MQWKGQEKIVSRFELELRDTELLPVSKYLFNVVGKNIRPRLVSSVAGAVNVEYQLDADVKENVRRRQELVVEMCEMFHTASLYHDDVIDHADTRRGQPSVPAAWSIRHADNN